MARSKKKQTFIAFVNKRYNQLFRCWDDYALFLYYDLLNEDKNEYYKYLENDIWDYSDMQVGGDRDYERQKTRTNHQTKD